MGRIERTMPVVALSDMIVMPGMLMHFDVNKRATIAAVEQAMMEEQFLFVVAEKEQGQEKSTLADLYDVGTIVLIKQMVRMPGNYIRVMVLGVERARLVEFLQRKPYLSAKIISEDDDTLSTIPKEEQKAMLSNLREDMEIYASENGKIGEKALHKLSSIENLSKFMDELATHMPMDFKEKQRFLSTFDIQERYTFLAVFLQQEIEVGRLRRDFQTKVKGKMDQNQKEYLLREQMKVIREELGEGDTVSDSDGFMKQLRELEASDDVKAKIKKEIDRFRSLGNNSSETAVVRGYIETLLALPWDKRSEDCKDFSHTKKVLEDEHYGLEKVKERIMESLAVRMLIEKGDSPILCLVGPPGTGKTSIARSMAKALHKEYVRICLGGVRDEAEIRGHRRTYVGAMPGRVANAMKNAKVKNPLILLDEIDKVSSDYKGDTSSALLEVLDSEQNRHFVDHYVEIPMDLSEVFFVATANSLQTIPKPLLDRMEVIEVSSYTENEKFQIARQYLLKKQLEKNGLKPKQITIDKRAMEAIIHGYTREAGVRNLERTIGKICRKVAMEALEQVQDSEEASLESVLENTKVRVTTRNLEHYLGKVKYRDDEKKKKPQIGIVRGLAWTSVGGDTLEIEVNVMPGKGKFVLTGQLGDVMKESAQIALTYVRSLSEAYQIPEEWFDKHDIHIHVPEGATPKDGPSAGITMTTAILSAVTGKKIRGDIAMTGEVTLRGRVLPIGGLKEKLLAAKQADMKTVLVPADNQKDVEELDAEITEGVEILFVKQMKDVLSEAML